MVPLIRPFGSCGHAAEVFLLLLIVKLTEGAELLRVQVGLQRSNFICKSDKTRVDCHCKAGMGCMAGDGPSCFHCVKFVSGYEVLPDFNLRCACEGALSMYFICVQFLKENFNLEYFYDPKRSDIIKPFPAYERGPKANYTRIKGVPCYCEAPKNGAERCFHVWNGYDITGMTPSGCPDITSVDIKNQCEKQLQENGIQKVETTGISSLAIIICASLVVIMVSCVMVLMLYRYCAGAMPENVVYSIRSELTASPKSGPSSSPPPHRSSSRKFKSPRRDYPMYETFKSIIIKNMPKSPPSLSKSRRSRLSPSR